MIDLLRAWWAADPDSLTMLAWWLLIPCIFAPLNLGRKPK